MPCTANVIKAQHYSPCGHSRECHRDGECLTCAIIGYRGAEHDYLETSAKGVDTVAPQR